MRQHKFDASVLREYDIRGVVGTTIAEADAYAIGRGFATIAGRDGGRRICVGYDGRLTSPGLAEALSEGLRAAGADVVNIGRGPTPMLYFSVYNLAADGGIMITGSHNPPDYNGFKMMLGKKPFFGDQIQEIGRLAAAGDWAEGAGGFEEVSVFDAYMDELVAAYTTDKPLAVAWDCGHGVTGDSVPTLIKRLPGRHRMLFERVDGNFPAHHPDPTVEENLIDLQKAVHDDKLDVGIAFDGDGDRIGVIDNLGRILWGDQLLALMARDVLRDHPGATIIADVKASQVLFDDIAKSGGEPMMFKTGHSLIKSKMAEVGSPLAGEMSGHIFFADKYYGFDDALYVAVRFLDIVARSGMTAAALRDTLPQVVNTPEVRFDCDDATKFGIVEDVKERLMAQKADVNDIDGVRVSTPDGWWLLRASNTQPVLVVRCEAADQAGLDRLKSAVKDALAPSGIAAPAGF